MNPPNSAGSQLPSAFVPVDHNGHLPQNHNSAFLPVGGHPHMASMFQMYNPTAALMMLQQNIAQMSGMQNPNPFAPPPPLQSQLVSLKREVERDSGNESGSVSPMSSRSSRSNSNQFNFSISNLIPTDQHHQQQQPPPAQPIVEQPNPVISQASTPPPAPHFPPVSQMHTPQLHHPNLAQFHHSPWHQPHPFLQSPLLQSPLTMNQASIAQMNALYGTLPQGSELCVVCGDKASGHHYGVVSCEGCKGFFRRSVQKNCKYECAKDGKCQVARHTRNRCQCCRYEKCMKEGMTRESVRQDRNKSRKNREESDYRQLDEMRRMQALQENVVKAYQNTLGDHLPADKGQTRSLIKLFLAGINEFVDIADDVKTRQIESRFDAFIELRRLVMSDPCTGLLPPQTEGSSGSRPALDRLRSCVDDDTIRLEEMAILSTWCLLHSYGDETLARHQSDLTTCLKAQLATHNKQGALNVLMLNSGELCH